MARGEPIAAGVTQLEIDLHNGNGNRLVVDVKANVGDLLLRRLQGLGVTILDANAAYGSLRLEANLDQVELIAAFPEVIFVSQAAQHDVGG
jgi:hypothetical protein